MKKWELQSKYSTKMTQRMDASFLTGRLMVNNVRSNGKLSQMTRNLDFKWFQISGHSTIEFMKYPMAVLGGKSRPKLKNLKPFIKVIMYLSHSLHCYRKQEIVWKTRFFRTLNLCNWCARTQLIKRAWWKCLRTKVGKRTSFWPIQVNNLFHFINCLDINCLNIMNTG